MAGIAYYLVFLGVFTLVSALHTTFNIDEINAIHYAVDILNKPVIKDQAREGEVMAMVNKYGQEYLCFLPAIGPLHSDYKHDDDILDQLVDISVLLKPMETAPCLIKTVDWWTYEFCYNSVIKQYHLEDNKASGPIIILGKYESEYNWRNSSETKNRLQRFHSQFYVNGTKCDLTGEARGTEVRFHCEDGVGDYIQRVDEPESCRYVVTVATTRVCHHPYLRLQVARSPHTITCAPALTQDQYNKYLLYQEKKLKEEQELEKKLFQQNAEILQETGMGDGSSLVQPSSSEAQTEDDDDDDNLKMNIKIFRVSPTSKHKTKHARDAKEDLVEVETQITLEEEADTHLKGEDMKVPLGSKEGMGGTAEGEGTRGSTEGEEIVKKVDDPLGGTMEGDSHSLMSSLKPHKLLQLLDPTEPYITETEELEEENEVEDELEEEVEDDDDDDEAEKEVGLEDMEALWQASKSTKRDHFAKLQKRLRQLGKMFINQEATGARDAETDKIAEFRKMVDTIKEGHIRQLERQVNEWNQKILSKEEVKDTDKALDEEEQRLGTALSSVMKALDVAEEKLSRVKKEMEVLEDYLDHELKEMDSPGSEASKPSTQAESPPQDQDSQDSHPPIQGSPPNSHTSEEPLKETSSRHAKEEGDKVEEDGQQKRLAKVRVEDESQKTKLEQTIKDKLQKLGHEKIGRKFEVKILTPNSLEDEDASNSMLSQEEVEAFQNMIVNLLVWLLILASVPTICIVFACVMKAEANIFRQQIRGNPFSTAAFWVVKALTQEATEWLPRTDGSRLLVVTWLLASLVFMSSYSGILTAMLTVPRVTIPIDSLQDLVSQSWMPWRLESGSWMLQYFRESPGGVSRDVYEGHEGNIGDCWAAREPIARGHYAGICDHTTMKKAMSWDFSTTGTCHLYIAQQVVFSFNLAVAFRTKSPYKKKANYWIMKLKEAGVIDMWLNNEIVNTSQCLKSPSTDRPSTQISALDLESYFGSFLVLIVGMIMALISFMVEILTDWCRRHGQRQE